MSAGDDVTAEGRRLIENWIYASNQFKLATNELRRSEADLDTAARAVAKWMLPEDVKSGEKIAVWYGDSLVQVEAPCNPASGPVVTVRKRGKSLITLR